MNTGNCLPPKIFNGLKTKLDKKNAEKMQSLAEICGICANICEFLDTRHNFHTCIFENANICGKICDARVLAKCAIAYAIAYSHITSIPIKCNEVKLTTTTHATTTTTTTTTTNTYRLARCHEQPESSHG